MICMIWMGGEILQLGCKCCVVGTIGNRPDLFTVTNLVFFPLPLVAVISLDTVAALSDLVDAGAAEVPSEGGAEAFDDEWRLCLDGWFGWVHVCFELRAA